MGRGHPSDGYVAQLFGNPNHILFFVYHVVSYLFTFPRQNNHFSEKILQTHILEKYSRKRKNNCQTRAGNAASTTDFLFKNCLLNTSVLTTWIPFRFILLGYLQIDLFVSATTKQYYLRYEFFVFFTGSSVTVLTRTKRFCTKYVWKMCGSFK